VARSKTASRPLTGAPRRDATLIQPVAGGRLPSVKVILFGVVLFSLVGFVALALTRELMAGSQASERIASNRPVVAPRPALTAAEEAYARELWPVHGEIKLMAMRLASGSIQVKLKAMDRGHLQPRVDEAATLYERAEARIAQLQPPPSLQEAHAQYLQEVRLYRQSRDELALLFADGREEHMDAALAPREEASQILRKVGLDLWPNEYVPN